MTKIECAVFNTSPFIHLFETECLGLTMLFKKILTSHEVFTEFDFKTKDEISFCKNVAIKFLDPKSKDFSKYLIEECGIHLGEATSIALCKQENICLFFTDDLDARDLAKKFGLEVHGTLGIVTRAFKERMITKKDTLKIVDALYNKSSLFFTADLRDWTIREIEKTQ